jgi:stage IV sporulation protein FB
MGAVRGGYLTLGRWRKAPVRAHWSLPIGALVFGQGRFVPGFWLGFFLLVLIHELGHAVLVKRYGHRIVSIDIHGLGGACRWSGEPTAIDRARIAWGGVLAQAVAYVIAWATLHLAGPPESVFVSELASAFSATNVWLIAINLIPIAPLDGAEAWKLPGLLAARRRTRGGAARNGAGFVYEREAASLQRYADEPPEGVKTVVDDALRRIAGDPKKPQD